MIKRINGYGHIPRGWRPVYREIERPVIVIAPIGIAHLVCWSRWLWEFLTWRILTPTSKKTEALQNEYYRGLYDCKEYNHLRLREKEEHGYRRGLKDAAAAVGSKP